MLSSAKKLWISQIIYLLLLVAASSALTTTSRAQLLANLQQCTTPDHVLHRIGRRLSSAVDPNGEVARLALVRLSKLLIGMDNKKFEDKDKAATDSSGPFDASVQYLPSNRLEPLVEVLLQSHLGQSPTDVDSFVEGVKAISVMSRLLPELGNMESEVVANLHKREYELVALLEEQTHLISGLDWAVESMRLKDSSLRLPWDISKAVMDANLSFRIYPGLLRHVNNLSVAQFSAEVDFQVESIRTASQQIVPERRETAWQGDDGIGPFLYSGKAMPRKDWSPLVRKMRDILHSETRQYYDCCLLNLYPDASSGMRYHVDPDQGVLWDYDTAVVSVGASRRFSFRELGDRRPPHEQRAQPQHRPQQQALPHNFVVMHGDVTHMFRDCQSRFQHTVKAAEQREESAPRVSLVYKRTWAGRAVNY